MFDNFPFLEIALVILFPLYLYVLINMSVKGYLDAYWESKLKHMKAIVTSGLHEQINSLLGDKDDDTKEESNKEDGYKH